MKRATKQIIIFIVTFSMLFFLMAEIKSSTAKSSRETVPGKIADLSHIKVKKAVHHPKMSGDIHRLYTIYKTEGKEAAMRFALEKQINLRNNRLPLQIKKRLDHNQNISPDPGPLSRPVRPARAGGNSPNPVQTNEAVIRLDRLEQLLDDPSVKHISRVPRPEPDIESEGVEVTGARAWFDMVPYKTGGSGVKVAVIDIGFDGYEDLLGTELPANVAHVSFFDDGSPGQGRHGTGCAEVIHDMAPDAELHLLAIDSYFDLDDALQYCIDNNIGIISQSLSFRGASASDGTGWECDLMRIAHENGIIWVKSGGNDGSNHWSGLPSDPDGDGWINFSGQDEILELESRVDRYYRVTIDWDDWGPWDGQAYRYSGSDQDFDLYLFYWNGTQWEEFDKSVAIQDGDDIPFESIRGLIENDGRYGIGIRRVSGNRDVRLHVIVPGSGSYGGLRNLEYRTYEMSVNSSATCPDAVAAGAFRWDDLTLAYYSSQGPTRDGRIKPEIAAPTQVSCSAYGEHGFSGTSAACPHVAGAIALIRSRLPFTTREQILSILNSRAIDRGEPGKDNVWGIGQLFLR